MTAPPLTSGFRWEQRFFAFLRTELAPSPSRWRNTLRLTLLCAIGTTLVLSFHIPYGEFLIIFFFAVSQPDAWASMRKAKLRGIGTFAGGALAMLGIVVCVDKPWLFFVAQGLLFAVALFLSRTTTIPYAVILAMFTFVIATPVAATAPEVSLETVFWRILLTVAGAVIGTVAQLVLWPEHPEKLLLRELATRLQVAESILDRAASTTGASRGIERTHPQANADVSSGMVNQLDLLASAEAGNRWLRQHHAEQIKLITDVEMVFITALRLERSLGSESSSNVHTEHTRDRLQIIRRDLVRFRRVLEEAPTTNKFSGDDQSITTAIPANESSHLQSIVSAMEHALRELTRSMAFLALPDAHRLFGKRSFEPLREPVAERTIFTDACTLSNAEAVKFALKGSLAASLCYVLYQALNWPGISTCVVTCLITAQSSFGAGLQKSLLRLTGATLGGLAAVATVVTLVPNMDDAASFVVVTSALFFAASWLTTGSSRISYVGLQVGLVLALVLLNRPDQSIDLAAAGDRILGVLLGITVMGFIDLTLWPNFARTVLQQKLTATSRALAEVARHALRREWDQAREAEFAVHRNLAATLARHDEWQFEFGSRETGGDAERQRLLTIIHQLEEVLRALLVVVRHRSDTDQQATPAAWRECLSSFDEAIARRLERLTGAQSVAAMDALPDIHRLLSKLDEEMKSFPIPDAASETQEIPPIDCLAACRELVEALEALETKSNFSVRELPRGSASALVTPRSPAT